MLPNVRPGVHALLRLSETEAFVWDQTRPAWALDSLRRAPWVVVRRAARHAGLWPVGLRGMERAQRCAGWLPEPAIADCITPQQLAACGSWRHRRIDQSPAVRALDEAAALFAVHGQGEYWGPVGSVGFELGSGVRTTTAASDLDLVLRADEPMSLQAARALHADLLRLSVRTDVLLETPQGAVALCEYVAGSALTLLRTVHGARLVQDPWAAATAAASTA